MDDLLIIVLKDTGVSDTWIEIAADIGAENFLSMWERLSDDSESGSSIRIQLPKFKLYLRYRRDLYIRSLAEGGMSSRNILNHLKYEQGKVPSLRHIQRIIKVE